MVRSLAPFRLQLHTLPLPVVALAALANHRLNSWRPSGAPHLGAIVQDDLWVKGSASRFT